jgi:hypothetical protein
VKTNELEALKNVCDWMRDNGMSIGHDAVYKAARAREFQCITTDSGRYILARRSDVVRWYQEVYTPRRPLVKPTTAAPVAKKTTTCDVSEIAAEIRNLAGAWRGETSSDIAELKARMDRIEQAFVAMRIPIRDIEGGANG